MPKQMSRPIRRPPNLASSSATGLLLAEAGQHLHPPGVDVVHAASELVGQVPAGQVDVGATWSRCCDVRRTWRSHVVPSPSAPDRSGTDAGSCAWRTAAPRPPIAMRRTTFDHVHKLNGCAVVAARLRQEQRPPGPAHRRPMRQIVLPAAPRSAPSTAPRARAGSSSSPPAPAASGGPDPGRRCAASTTPPAAAPRHRPGRASPGCAPARPPRPPGSPATAARSGSTAVSSAAAPGRAAAHPTGRPGRIPAPPNRIRLPHALLDQEVEEQPHRHQPLLDRRVGQPRTRSRSTPRSRRAGWAARQLTDENRDVAPGSR